MKKLNFTKQKILYSWLRSFILVLLIPIILMVVVYWRTTAVMEEEINRANKALLQQLQQEIDGQFESIQRMSQEIALNARVGSLLYGSGNLVVEERMKIYQALNDFRIYSSTNQSAKRFYLYLKHRGFILTEGSYFDPAVYYELNHWPKSLSYEAWIELMHHPHRGEMVHMDPNGTDGSLGNDSAVFMLSLPLEDMQQSKATLVIHLELSRIQLAMENIQKYQNGDVYVLDGNNDILWASVSASSPVLANPDLWGEMRGEFGVLHIEESGHPLTVSYAQSESVNWKYVYILPSEKFHEKAEFVRDLSFFFIAAALVIGLVLAFLFARKHYHPLKGLVHSMASRVDIQRENGADEFLFLEKAMDFALEENNELSLMIDRQHAMLRSNFLARLVKGRVESHEPLEESFASHQMKFISDRFALLLFYVEDYSGLFQDNERDAEKNLKLVHLIIQNIVEELAGRRHLGYVAEADDMLFCLVNFREGLTESEAFTELTQVAHDAKRFIQVRFRIEFSISVSNIHRTFRGLPDAYQEALQAMEYKILNANPSVILYDQVRSYNGIYTYTLEKEQQLINYIKVGAVNEAKVTVDEIMDGCSSVESPISVEMARCLMFNLTSTMLKASMEVSSRQQELFAENQKSIQALLNSHNIAEMRRQLGLFLHMVCTHVEDKKNSHNLELRDTVLRLIEEQYTDGNLSLTVLAEECKVSPSYLSRFFKEQVGITLSDYITKYRVDKAKVLLIGEDFQQKHIAEQVGFSSISTFIRTFKKWEGVTPGMYREANK